MDILIEEEATSIFKIEQSKLNVARKNGDKIDLFVEDLNEPQKEYISKIKENIKLLNESLGI
jgi:hypothetical protein